MAGAISFISLWTAEDASPGSLRRFGVFERMTLVISRIACRSPRFAFVMSRSTTGCRRLALASVVVMRLCSIRLVARLASMRRSCAGPLPSRGPLVGVGIVHSLCRAITGPADRPAAGSGKLVLGVVAAVEVRRRGVEVERAVLERET